MEGLGAAASVTAIVDISANVASLCYQYLIKVKDAKEDIKRLGDTVHDTKIILEKLQQLLAKQDESQLSATHTLKDSLERCRQELKKLSVTLQAKLEQRGSKNAMHRFGLRALKWPFTSKEVEKTIQNLEKYGQNFSRALLLDQTVLVLDVHRKLELTKLPVATGASFNSHTEEHNARCLPNTRTELLKTIADWPNDKDTKSIFWLRGMSGTGKSTIARTVAESFAKAGHLGASFFFKKGERERGNAARFFSTIAADLVIRVPAMLPAIMKALEEDPSLSQRALKDQFEKLILHPLSAVQQKPSTSHTYVVVIDALDECEGDSDIQAILQLLAQTKTSKSVSLRVFVTSRPELPIRLGFKEMSDGTYEEFVLHDVSKQTIQHDICVYFEHELAQVQRDRSLSADWPSVGQIESLVQQAVPLFIFAATACRYISDPRGNPRKSLETILRYQKREISKLDATYLPILNQLFDNEDSEDTETWAGEFREIVGSIVILETPLSVASLARLLRLPKQDITCRLDSLHSVLSIPDSDNVPIRLLHLSFREFLLDASKKEKSPFWVDKRVRHEKLASHCLELMTRTNGLRQNICGLQPGDLRSEVDEGKITSYILPELQYACRYWVHHLEQSQLCVRDNDSTDTFLRKHFLHWLEAMSLIGETNRCTFLLGTLQTLVNSSNSPLSLFIQDSQRFTLRFRHILEEAPLQIYSSALVFAPEASLIRKTFVNEIPDWIKVLSMREPDWGACRSICEGHTDLVAAVAFSPDGKLVASTSWDSAMRVWDAATGSCHTVLKARNFVNTCALAFLSDGRRVALATYVAEVQIWDVMTGSCCNVLQGHATNFCAVTFSPDGGLFASVEGESTISIWETTTKGSYRSLLEGHTSKVYAIALSLDGKRMASASMDRSIRIWEVETGRCCKVLEDHDLALDAVAFSPDGKQFASTSRNCAVMIQETTEWTYCSVLKGHTNPIRAIVFSPNGKLVATASIDHSVRLWELATGLSYCVLEGNTSLFSPVAFSPDGKLFASSSETTTVRIWDVTSQSNQGMTHKHTNTVIAVCFSQDGKLAASASYDDTVRVWEVRSGVCLRIIQVHATLSKVIAFSQDGKLLAVAAPEEKVWVWDVETGLCRSFTTDHEYLSKDGQYMHTIEGDFPLNLSANFPISPATRQEPERSSISVLGHWVFSDQQRLLWLPPEYRPICYIVKENVACLAQNSGHVTLLKFDVT